MIYKKIVNWLVKLQPSVNCNSSKHFESPEINVNAKCKKD